MSSEKSVPAATASLQSVKRVASDRGKKKVKSVMTNRPGDSECCDGVESSAGGASQPSQGRLWFLGSPDEVISVDEAQLYTHPVPISEVCVGTYAYRQDCEK